MKLAPSVLYIPVTNWQLGFNWYRQAFPEAIPVEFPEEEFRALRIGTFTIEVVESDKKLPSGKSGTVLYWFCEDLDQALSHFKQLGAALYRGPLAVEAGLRMCQVSDPFGNLIGLKGY